MSERGNGKQQRPVVGLKLTTLQVHGVQLSWLRHQDTMIMAIIEVNSSLFVGYIYYTRQTFGFDIYCIN